MCNILGPKGFNGKYLPIDTGQEDGVFLKMYLKEEAKPQRKMGHFNVVDMEDSKDIDELLRKVQQIKKRIRFQSP